MSLQVRWLASAPTSCLHAVDAQLSGRALVDDALRDAISAPAERLAQLMVAAGTERQLFMRHALPLSAGMDLNRLLAEVVLRKTIGGERTAVVLDDFSNCFGELRRAYQRVRGDVVQQLEIRSQPLRQLWDARGTGLVGGVARATEAGLIPDAVEVVAVDPATGGGGGAHLLYNSLRIEAVLANPLDALPETARIAWLVSQLNLDCPSFQGTLAPLRAAQCGALAMIPTTLFAAEDVELARLDPATTELAVTHWAGDPSAPHCDAAATARTLLDWWNVYQSSRPAWGVALAALDQMLAA
ncbi:MAG: hypothetical protein R3C10_04455 [Pirellulales bacterium]